MAQDTIAREKTARILEIPEGSRRVSLADNVLTVAGDEGAAEHIPVEGIAGLVAHRPGPTWSATALAALTERSIGIVLISPNYNSKTMSWPVPNRQWTARIRAQLSLYPPLARSLLGQLDATRRAQRALVLETMGKKRNLEALKAAPPPLRGSRPGARRRVEEQQEAEIERRYWPWLAGGGFRRDHRKEGANTIVNYGHTRLRIAATEAVHAARLHPGVGLRGRGGENGLADDLMIPFRPIVDLTAAIFIATGSDKVDANIENVFDRLLNAPLRGPNGLVQIRHGLFELAASLADCFETGNAKLTLQLPARQDPDAIFGLTAGDEILRPTEPESDPHVPTGWG